MVEEDWTTDEICKPRRPGHVLFPEAINMTTAINLCHKMKAEVSHVMSAVQQKQMDKLFQDTSGSLGLHSGRFGSNINYLLLLAGTCVN